MNIQSVAERFSPFVLSIVRIMTALLLLAYVGSRFVLEVVLQRSVA